MPVVQIARLNSFRNCRLPCLAAGVRRVVRAAACSFLGRSIEVDLHVGIWKDDAADIASFHHDTALQADRTLT